MKLKEPGKYKYNGARSLVLLHEKHLFSLVETWREAKTKKINLPETEDPDYKSLETLLHHILRSARGYMIWICENFNLPDPGINNAPAPDFIETEAGEYLTHISDKWGIPLSGIEEEKFHSPTYTSRWGVEYCIDAMLEHAVMHPIRHEFQLKDLIRNQNKK